MIGDTGKARKILTSIVKKALIGSIERGQLGRVNTDASVTYQVKGKEGKVYVTRQDGTLEEAINKPNFPLDQRYYVEFRREYGHYVILGPATHPSVPFTPIPRTLASLEDVDLSSQTDGYVLTWDETEDKAILAPSSGGGGSSWITDWSYRSNARSSSAFAWKGNEFTPAIDVEILALAYYGTLVAGATYQAAIITGTASPGNIATRVLSASRTLPGSLPSTDGGWIWLFFGSPQVLTAGTVYGLMVGRTDSTDTYALPVPFTGGTTTETAVPIFGGSHGRAWRVADASLDVGSAIDLQTTNSVGCGFMFRYP